MSNIKDLLSRLTLKQSNFYNAITDPDSDTCGDIENSYYKAGYKKGPTSLYKARSLYYSSKIQAIISLQRQKTTERAENRAMSDRDRILTKIDAIEQSCWTVDDNGIRHCIDRSAALKSLELRGKAIALWIDKTESSYDTSGFVLEAAIKQEALELAKRRLLGDDVIDTTAVDITDQGALEAGTEAEQSKESIDNEQVRDFLSQDPPKPPKGAGVDDTMVSPCVPYQFQQTG